VEVADTEHFLTRRDELGALFAGKKQYLMERFYRVMRERTGLLMNGDTPIGGQWNFDKENRGRPPKTHVAPPPLLFDHDLRDVRQTVGEARCEDHRHRGCKALPLAAWTARKA
jgi:deoxyribodipyrimidine photolyase-related protein